MGKIFTPASGVISPEYFDGLQNVVTRVPGLSTQALAFASIGSVEILPNVFSSARNNVSLFFKFIGQFVGIAGNKQFRSLIDATTIATSQSVNPAATPSTFAVEVLLVFRDNQISAQMRSKSGPGGTGALTHNSLEGIAFTAFDPTISHTLTLQALVTNAADLIRCDWIGASLI